MLQREIDERTKLMPKCMSKLGVSISMVVTNEPNLA